MEYQIKDAKPMNSNTLRGVFSFLMVIKSHKEILQKLKVKAVSLLLPWIAAVVTGLKYSDKRSGLIDRLVDMVES